MQQSLVLAIFFHHILVAPTLYGMAIISKHNYTFIPDPILLYTDPDLVLPEKKLTREAGPAFRPRHSAKNAVNTKHKLNLIAGRTGMFAADPPTFDLISYPNGSVNITAAVSAAAGYPPYSVFRLTSRGRYIKYCVPFAAAAAAGAPGDPPSSEVQHHSALVRHLPLNTYCIQLGCSCQSHWPCRRRPTRCKQFKHRAGIDMRAWELASNLSVWHADTAAGPTVSVSVLQTGYRFESFNLFVLGCRPGQVFNTTLAADQWVRLDTICSLQYNSSLTMQALPVTWFCGNSAGGCRDLRANIGPLQRQPMRRPPVLRVAAPPGWLTAALVLLAVTTVAVAATGLLWSRRRHRRYIASLAGAAGCQSFISVCSATAAGRRVGPSVLLLHLAHSDAERAAVRQLAAELRARGAAVIDSGTPEWRRAARRDATALVSVVPAGGRVLLLSSPAVAAAVAAGGGPGEPERLLAAAVRQLAGSRLTTDYGRLYQARLTADAPAVADLVPGAVYTLPEHQHELVTGLLASNSSDTVNGTVTDTMILPAHTADPGTLANDGVAELTV